MEVVWSINLNIETLLFCHIIERKNLIYAFFNSQNLLFPCSSIGYFAIAVKGSYKFVIIWRIHHHTPLCFIMKKCRRHSGPVCYTKDHKYKCMYLYLRSLDIPSMSLTNSRDPALLCTHTAPGMCEERGWKHFYHCLENKSHKSSVTNFSAIN